jgi:hypothetical protein
VVVSGCAGSASFKSGCAHAYVAADHAGLFLVGGVVGAVEREVPWRGELLAAAQCLTRPFLAVPRWGLRSQMIAIRGRVEGTEVAAGLREASLDDQAPQPNPGWAPNRLRHWARLVDLEAVRLPLA